MTYKKLYKSLISRFSENKRADANLLKDRKYIFYRFSSGKRTKSISNYKIENIKERQDRL